MRGTESSAGLQRAGQSQAGRRGHRERDKPARGKNRR